MPRIQAAHPDFELKFPRTSIDYEVALPSGGCDGETGLIFYIHGYGASYNDLYTQKLRKFFADTYNCIVCTVDYFGSRCFTNLNMTAQPDFFVKLEKEFGIKVSVSKGIPIAAVFDYVFKALEKMGVKSLPPDMHLVTLSDHYISFSVLPALDHIQVLHALLGNYPINRQRIFVLGTSNGGNIALFMNKIAPNTMRLVIDNSGFSSCQDNLWAIYGFVSGERYGVSFGIRNTYHFVDDPSHPAFFTPAHAAIRDLANPAHYVPSDTVVHSYHSTHDTIAPFAAKLHLHDVLQAFRPGMLHVIERDDHLDGHTFKVLSHGMNASMRSLFARSYQQYMGTLPNPSNHTDFDLKTRLAFPCGDKIYTVSYTKQGCRMGMV